MTLGDVEFCYNLSPIGVEKLRGHFVHLLFKLPIDPIVGRLYNIDPTTGTVFLFDIQGQSMSEVDEVSFKIVLKHSIESITSMIYERPSWNNLIKTNRQDSSRHYYFCIDFGSC